MLAEQQIARGSSNLHVQEAFKCLSSRARWKRRYRPGGVCQPLHCSRTEFGPAADRGHPGPTPGEGQGLLPLRDGQLPAQLLWHLHPDAVPAEGTYPGHAPGDHP